MKFSSFVVLAMALLAFGGCLINQRLTAMHVDDTPITGVFADICAPEGNPEFDCRAVIKTKWAVWPPREADALTGGQRGVPVALLGWWYFTAVGLWCVLVGRCDHARRGWHYLLLFAVVCGCSVSVFYLYILFFSGMEAKCLWCMISHGINFLLLVGALLLIPRRASDTSSPVVDQSSLAEGVPAAPVDPPAHPSLRLVLATVIGALALVWGEFTVTGATASRRRAELLEKAAQQKQMIIDEFYQDTEALAARYEAEETIKIKHGPDAPRRGEGDMLLPLVVFSDFQCPACRAFARQLDEQIVPAFDNLLRIYWKHLPWSTDCNPLTKRNMHPQACMAAYAAEAARMLGGNDSFWAAHDRMFESQRTLAKMDYRQLANDLGLDADEFEVAMASDEAKQHVTADIELAKSMGVKATPQIYLWGRKVDRKMLMNTGFVERINTSFRQTRKKILADRQRSTPASSPKPSGAEHDE